jgi:hypothetical protein
MEAPSSYLTYVIFVENCLFLALKLTTILAMGALLHALRFRPQRLRVKHISVAMFAYLGTHLTFSLLTLPCVALYKNSHFAK